MHRRTSFLILILLMGNLLPVSSASNKVQAVANSAVTVPETALFSANVLSPLEQNSAETAIYLRSATIATGAGQPKQSLEMRTETTSGPALWLVQFVGPIRTEWVEGLLSSGLEIVTYIPENAYLVWGENPQTALADFAAKSEAVRWIGAYLPAYRLEPGLNTDALFNNGEEWVDATVQFYQTAGLKESLNRLAGLARQIYQPPVSIQFFTHLRVELPSSALDAVAAWPDVVNIEKYQPPVLLDEVQGQILAGNLMQAQGNTVPSSPGYLQWLISKGFPDQPAAYPIVDLMDDGLDGGSATDVLHADFYVRGLKTNPDRVSYINNCTSDEKGNGIGGHGNLNAGILGGYNQSSGFPYQDAAGYQLGLGVSPFGWIASTKIFSDTGWYDASACGNSFTTIVQSAYSAGARITSNSWGASTAGAYTVDAQIYDLLTRDASPLPGNQEMLHIFAAGNMGPTTGSISSPATAKNVITVGATENVRDEGIEDGCYSTEANNADDIAFFSSRGPAIDGRIKPDIVAPGIHIQGPASQDPGYTSSGICGSMANGIERSPYYPSGQTLYTWSSGTSHAAPAVSGIAQLAHNYYQRVLKPGQTPSPAMLKALILNTPRYLQGTDAGDNLPSQHQGWGSAHMRHMFDDTSRVLLDQTWQFTQSSENYAFIGQVSDLTRPLHISLVWTDAPGSPAAAQALVNDLDLEVTIGGKTYKGNVFNGSVSAVGGSADHKNNVENIFLPAGQTGVFQVRVTARSLPGDGIPGNDALTDQDFALVIYNAVESTQPYLTVGKTTWVESKGNLNGFIDPGETIDLNIELENRGKGEANNITAVLLSDDSSITLIKNTASYDRILPGSARSNTIPFQIKVSSNAGCRLPLPLLLKISYNQREESAEVAPLIVGQAVRHTYESIDPPVNIPDYDQEKKRNGEAQVKIPINHSYDVIQLEAMVDIRHTWVSDLELDLTSPGGNTIQLSSKNGGMGDHYQGTIFDDQAALPISAGSAPFNRRYRPEQPLSIFADQPVTGVWTLTMRDVTSGDIGSVLAFSLTALEVRCTPYTAGPSVKVPVDKHSGRPGSQVTFRLEITNMTDKVDTYTIHAQGNWPVSANTAVGPLAPDQSTSTFVQVNIPGGAQLGDRETIHILVTSQNDSASQTEVTLTAEAASIIWLPLIQRP
jgi:subtilisin-like proprotein convertase family protein